jgi:hypothetical protein
MRPGAAIPLLLSRSHRLHRNSISVGCARNFGRLPIQLIEFVKHGFIRGIEGINLVADHQSLLSAFLHADTNAICGGDIPFSVLSAAPGIADTHTVEPNRDPEEVRCEALRVPLPYVRETPELGHWHEVLRGILHRPEKSQDASLLPAQELSTSTHIHASDQP